jgi:hypothetical protein
LLAAPHVSSLQPTSTHTVSTTSRYTQDPLGPPHCYHLCGTTRQLNTPPPRAHSLRSILPLHSPTPHSWARTSIHGPWGLHMKQSTNSAELCLLYPMSMGPLSYTGAPLLGHRQPILACGASASNNHPNLLTFGYSTPCLWDTLACCDDIAQASTPSVQPLNLWSFPTPWSTRHGPHTAPGSNLAWRHPNRHICTYASVSMPVACPSLLCLTLHAPCIALEQHASCITHD